MKASATRTAKDQAAKDQAVKDRPAPGPHYAGRECPECRNFVREDGDHETWCPEITWSLADEISATQLAYERGYEGDL